MNRERWIIAAILLLGNALAGLAWWLIRNDHEFADPPFFWALLILPLISLHYFLLNGKMQARISASSLDQLRSGGNALLILRIHFPIFLRLLTFAAFIIALARPQSKTSYENMTKEGIDIVLSMDVSGSMLSQDFKPNRLESSKEVALDFVQDRPHDRLGLVIYEGESFTQVPLTSDHTVVKNAIAALQTGLLEGGTAIGMGLATATSRLKDSDAKSKVIILLTDGVNNSGQVKPIDAAKIAKAFGIRVYTIGVGTTGKAKSPVRVLPDGTYLFDWVEVKIDEEVLTDIAKLTGGKYFRATSREKLREIYQEIDQLEKTRFNVTQFSRKTEEYLRFALFGMFLLLGEFIWREMVNRGVA